MLNANFLKQKCQILRHCLLAQVSSRIQCQTTDTYSQETFMPHSLKKNKCDIFCAIPKNAIWQACSQWAREGEKNLSVKAVIGHNRRSTVYPSLPLFFLSLSLTSMAWRNVGNERWKGKRRERDRERDREISSSLHRKEGGERRRGKISCIFP